MSIRQSKLKFAFFIIILSVILLSGIIPICGYFFLVPARYDITLNQPLHSAAEIPIGVAVSPILLETDTQYRDLVLEHFNLITAENVMKMGQLRPSNYSHFYWEKADYVVDFAMNNSMQIHGHCLVWHQQVPDWLNEFEGDIQDWRNLLKTHIQTVVGRYKGKIASWDVVNEAFLDEGYRETIWYTKIGPNYIKDAFIWAHEADPEAKLYYNDYDLCFNFDKLQVVVNEITHLLDQGVPIHGLGFQLHFSRRNPSVEEIRHAVELVEELPLEIRISELDIEMNTLNFYRKYTKPLANKQKDLYSTLTKELLNLDNLTSITFWGVTDRYSWRNRPKHPDWPLLFDEEYKPKPAAEGFLETLQEHFF